MSAEKKVRVASSPAAAFVGASGCYKVLSSHDMSRCVLAFVCVIDLLKLKRCSRLLSRLIDAYWNDGGMIKNFYALFLRETGLTRDFMTKMRESGGVFTGPMLAKLIACPGSKLARVYYMYPDAADFVCRGPLILDSDVCRNRQYDPKQDRILVDAWMTITMKQQYYEWHTPTHKHEDSWVVTGNYSRQLGWIPSFKYKQVTCNPKEFVLNNYNAPWERCTFDGERLNIADVNAFIQAEGKLKRRVYRRPAHSPVDIQTILDLQYNMQERWKQLGFTLSFNGKALKPRFFNGLFFDVPRGVNKSGRMTVSSPQVVDERWPE